MRRLHIDDFRDSNCKYPIGQPIEGLTTSFFNINADKLYSVLNKICPVFILVGYLFYFVENYEPFRWPPYGNFIAFNFVDKSVNYIQCKNATGLTGWETPSLLRMAVLKAFPSIFLRAAILPLIFGRLLFLFLTLNKWRRQRKDQKHSHIEPLTISVALMELLSVAIFTATTSHLDSLYHHQTFGVSFVVLALVSFILIIFISKELEPSIQYPLMFYTGIFTISAPIVLYNYFKYQHDKTCSPLVEPQYTLLEILAILSYILFYWKANIFLKDIDLVVFSSKTEIMDVDSRIDDNITNINEK